MYNPGMKQATNVVQSEMEKQPAQLRRLPGVKMDGSFSSAVIPQRRHKQ